MRLLKKKMNWIWVPWMVCLGVGSNRHPTGPTPRKRNDRRRGGPGGERSERTGRSACMHARRHTSRSTVNGRAAQWPWWPHRKPPETSRHEHGRRPISGGQGHQWQAGGRWTDRPAGAPIVVMWYSGAGSTFLVGGAWMVAGDLDPSIRPPCVRMIGHAMGEKSSWNGRQRLVGLASSTGIPGFIYGSVRTYVQHVYVCVWTSNCLQHVPCLRGRSQLLGINGRIVILSSVKPSSD